MARKLQFQKIRTDDRKRPEPQNGKQFVVEPIDVALVAVIMLVIFWLQWLMGTLAT